MMDFTPQMLATLATSIATCLAKDKSSREIAVLQCVCLQVNATLATISKQRELLEAENKKTP